MCGRFTLHTPASAISSWFDVAVADLPPRYNIAPSQPVSAVRLSAAGPRQLDLLRWGLIPSWADDMRIGYKMINARAEGVATKPAFRQAFRSRRCLVVADGFYEWKKEGPRKQPYYVRLEPPGLLGFAGLWERWQRDGRPIESCTIVTTDANSLMRPLHERMPVIIPPEAYAVWLAPESSPAQLQQLLVPWPRDDLVAYPVRTTVNSPSHDAEDCIEPLEG